MMQDVRLPALRQGFPLLDAEAMLPRRPTATARPAEVDFGHRA